MLPDALHMDTTRAQHGMTAASSGVLLDTSNSSHTTTRRQLRTIASKGRYEDAALAVQQNSELRQSAFLSRQCLLAEEQAGQWNAFRQAKQRYAERECAAAVEQQQRLEELLEQKYQDDLVAHSEELEAFATREEKVIKRRPVTLSHQTVNLLREERALTLQQRFHDAAQTRDLAARQEAAEICAAQEHKQHLLRTKVATREEMYKKKELAAVKQLQARLLVHELQIMRRLDCTDAKLDRMEAGMGAAHAKERRTLLQLGCIPTESRAQTSRARRGTLLKERVQGDSYTIPSLCDRYGCLLDGENHLPLSKTEASSSPYFPPLYARGAML